MGFLTFKNSHTLTHTHTTELFLLAASRGVGFVLCQESSISLPPHTRTRLLWEAQARALLAGRRKERDAHERLTAAAFKCSSKSPVSVASAEMRSTQR